MPDESRHNPFCAIHRTLRDGHCRMVLDLGTAAFSDRAATDLLLGRLARLIALSRWTAEAQCRVLQPAIAERIPECPASAVPDFSSHAAALAELESLIRSLKVATPARREVAGRAIYRCHALFAAADMARMDAAETTLLTCLHRAFSDEELRAIEARMLAAMPKQESHERSRPADHAASL